jgi:transketolase
VKMTENDQNLANAIRFLSIDAVQRANSGHPGMPMGMADIVTVLWRQFLHFNPADPEWFNRDRFLLSNGHGSMLHYALLHLSGYAVSIDDLKNFRQFESNTPGHPEFGETVGVETTTGPLGQGLANGVGMAIAERMLAAQFNREQFPIVDHHTYVCVGDGCLMEGISHEACSLAGTLGLGKLIVLYDDNGISIDGAVDGWFTDNTPQRFEAYGWQVIDPVDGHDPTAIHAALTAARADTSKPTLICCKTQIGYGSPNKVGTAGSHGAPLGEDEIQLTREQLNWPHAPFDIPDEVYAAWNAGERGGSQQALWEQLFEKYSAAYPELAVELTRRMQGYLPENFKQQSADFVQQLQVEQQPLATRKSSQQAIEFYTGVLSEMIGGSADLTGSNGTRWSAATCIDGGNFNGRYINYGVREFAMSAIMNGLALHGGFVPFAGTFLVFSDYARNAVRLSALMRQKVIFVYTHDSIGLGEDGPTHQPIEHAAMLRLTPNLMVWRPADSVETAVAWQEALLNQGPSSLLLSRQTLPAYERDHEQLSQVARGGYVLQYEKGECDGIIMATGSEVEIAIEAAQQLLAEGLHVRVVSMPCVKRFLAQDASYKDHVLSPDIDVRVAIEAGSTAGWYQFVGHQGRVIGIDRFGFSAPCKQVYEACGVTVMAATQAFRDCLQQKLIAQQ